MVIVTPNLALLLFVFILIVSACIAWWMGSYDYYDKCSFHTFIVILAGLGVFITFMFYYSVVSLQQEQQELTRIEQTSRVSEKMISHSLDQMQTAAAHIPYFVLSLTPLHNCACLQTCQKDPSQTDIDTPENCVRKAVLSYHIFTMWQEVLLAQTFVTVQPQAYLVNFLQRASSRLLYEQWLKARINFNSQTQHFGNLLFEYALNHEKCAQADSYVELAQKLLADERYKQIVKK